MLNAVFSLADFAGALWCLVLGGLFITGGTVADKHYEETWMVGFTFALGFLLFLHLLRDKWMLVDLGWQEGDMVYIVNADDHAQPVVPLGPYTVTKVDSTNNMIHFDKACVPMKVCLTPRQLLQYVKDEKPLGSNS